MGFFRREKLHERLARQGGLNPRSEEPLYTGPPEPGVPGYHGVQRPRRWDAVIMAEAPDLPGDEVTFVVLADGAVILDAELPEPAVEPIAEELDQMVDAPYRVEAVRRHGDVWAAAARRVDLIELPEAGGEELTLALQDGTKSFSIDGHPEFGSVPALERFAGERFDSYVAVATRLDGDLFEVRVSPL
ncbi:MAG: hypothetical protein H0W87_08635 [Actinobacteria bacterium]|nr:hypothetical protein [Actinomycetota bacterium]